MIDVDLNVAALAALFWDVVKRRPPAAKAAQADVYTPDFGPYDGLGGIGNPDYVIAVDLNPPNMAAGGTIVMIVESTAPSTRVVVTSERNSANNIAGPVRSTRKRLTERLQSSRTMWQPATTAEAAEAVSSAGSVGQISSNAEQVAAVLSRTSGATFEEIGEELQLTMLEVSEAIKELEPLQTVIRERGGVYRFAEPWSPQTKQPDTVTA